MKNEITKEFKSLIKSQYTGIKDAYFNGTAFNVMCLSKSKAQKIAFDLTLAGLKNVNVRVPNPYSKYYHISATA